MAARGEDIVIVSVARTPIGAFQGEFGALSASALGAVAIRGALERAALPGDLIDELIMGCVLPAGQGQAPARQAGLAAGLALATGCTTINKMCGSGMKAIMLGHDVLRAGSARIVLAGGMESMSNAPYLLPKARAGLRMGHAQLLDHMFLDGLEDAYEKGRLMGTFAEDCASQYAVTREQQDQFALASLQRATDATNNGYFDWEIAPVEVGGSKQPRQVRHDETPLRARPDKVTSLKPAFRKDGTVTAANSSSISDGAAACVLMRRDDASKRGLQPVARIVGHASHAWQPALFPSAPVAAVRKLYERVGWTNADVDLFEVNEAFAVVAMVSMRDLGLPHDKLNVHGGACALGHPIGASGARIVVTLIGALRQRQLKRGVAAICIGGGEATAVAIEML